jgi:hypothetical protein
MKERTHYTYGKEWWCNDCGNFIYFPEPGNPNSCPKCQGSNIVLRDWKGYKKANPSASSIDPYDSRSFHKINFNLGLEKARTFAGFTPEEIFDVITQVEAQEPSSKYDIPEKVFTDKSYQYGFKEGLIYLIDAQNQARKKE